MWSAVLNFVAFVLIHPPHRRIALSLELVFQMMAKLFAALTDKAQVILLGDCEHATSSD
jgi:hypothetical protein